MFRNYENLILSIIKEHEQATPKQMQKWLENVRPKVELPISRVALLMQRIEKKGLLHIRMISAHKHETLYSKNEL